MDGPTTDAIDRLPLSRAIALTNRSRGTTATKTVFQATSKTTARVPVRNAIT